MRRGWRGSAATSPGFSFVYALKLVLWSILIALAVIGLLRIAGLDP